MPESTTIQWTDATFNPWWGCEKVSPGCAHCYADTIARHRSPRLRLWGEGHEFRFFADSHWAAPRRWARTLPAKLGRRPRVFCASMADVFEERPELEEHRLRLFALIHETPELDWQILTKRPEFAHDWLYANAHLPIANVWLGVSIENARFTWRADILRETPAAVRFISAEPLLGSLYPATARCPKCWHGAHGPTGCDVEVSDVGACDCGCLHGSRVPLALDGIDWLIVGGESGPRSRPLQLEHVHELLAACRKHAVAPFVKQLGARPVLAGKLADRKGGDIDEWPEELRVREFPGSSNIAALEEGGVTIAESRAS